MRRFVSGARRSTNQFDSSTVYKLVLACVLRMRRPMRVLTLLAAVQYHVAFSASGTFRFVRALDTFASFRTHWRKEIFSGQNGWAWLTSGG
jgi:hypothetical protein